MVLLVLKLLDSSHPLKLQRCPSIYVLLSYGQAEYHFVVFLLCSRQSLYLPCTLYIVFCLNCFSCYSMVTKFYCNIITTMSMLSYYDPSSMCFYILFDQDCVIACHLKNYCLLSLTYSGRVGVKLGMLIRRKRIYNF